MRLDFLDDEFGVFSDIDEDKKNFTKELHDFNVKFFERFARNIKAKRENDRRKSQ